MGVCHPSRLEDRLGAGHVDSVAPSHAQARQAGRTAAAFLQRTPAPAWVAGRHFNSLPHGVWAVAGAAGNERSGRRALGKTPRTPFAFKDSMIH